MPDLNIPKDGGVTTIFEDITKYGVPKPSGITGFSFAGKNPAEIIGEILPFIFIIAGLILFVMIIFGGFTIFTSAGNPEKMKQGQGMIVNALIGFIIIFAAYWIIQILETTLGFQITA